MPKLSFGRAQITLLSIYLEMLYHHLNATTLQAEYFLCQLVGAAVKIGQSTKVKVGHKTRLSKTMQLHGRDRSGNLLRR